MKLIYRLVNKNILFTKIVCIGVLFSLYANSAQITVVGPAPAGAPVNYVYNNIGWNDGGGRKLNTATLQHHLSSIRAAIPAGTPTAIATASQNCIRELSRMLLAQIPAAGGIGPGPHNVAGNNTPGYTIAAKAGGHPGRYNCDDIFLACDALKEHMLIHGHFGYFPMFSHSDHLGVSNCIISRGLFNIDLTIMNRINKSQRQIYNDFVRFL